MNSSSSKSMYEPQVDDYVVWQRPNGDVDEGWVYFKGEETDNEKRVKFGWRPIPRYLTIETGIRPKPQCEYSKNDPHKYIHTLLLCYEGNWNELKFVKRRNTREIQHWSQYDDIVGIEEDRLVKMYKSQDGRPLDIQ